VSTVGPMCTKVEGNAMPSLRPWLFYRAGSLVILLVAEIAFFWARFDAAIHAKIDGHRLIDFAQYSAVSRFAITTLVALLLCGGLQFARRFQSIAWNFEKPIHRPTLLLHFIALAAFLGLSIAEFEGGHGSWAHSQFWIGVWLATGMLSFAGWLAALLPLSFPNVDKAGALQLLAVSTAVATAAIGVGNLASQLWQPLAEGTLAIVEGLLRLFYSTVVVGPDRFVVGTDSYSIYIAPKCSGYEGIGLVTVFLGTFLWWFRKDLRFPQSLILLPIGIATIWIANAIRIAALIAIGTSISPEIAQGGFHSHAGWLAFNAITLGLVAVAWNSAMFSTEAQKAISRAAPAEYPAAPYLVPLLILVGTMMLTGAFSNGGFDRLYALRVLATAAAIGYFFQVYRREEILAWSWSWQPAAIGILVFAIWMVLSPLARAENSLDAEQAAGLASLSIPLATTWIIFRAVGSVITVPLTEELAFRGFLTRRLITADFASVPLGRFTWFSFVVSSIVFGLLHGSWLAGTIAGMLFAYALYRRGRLMDAVVAHATANALVTGYVLITGNWAAWS
jgi:exosortase E/protease (VPEID-CTERM system)